LDSDARLEVIAVTLFIGPITCALRSFDDQRRPQLSISCRFIRHSSFR
jgi:hypothetical protein